MILDRPFKAGAVSYKHPGHEATFESDGPLISNVATRLELFYMTPLAFKGRSKITPKREYETNEKIKIFSFVSLFSFVSYSLLGVIHCSEREILYD